VERFNCVAPAPGAAPAMHRQECLRYLVCLGGMGDRRQKPIVCPTGAAAARDERVSRRDLGATPGARYDDLDARSR
jgi:hypothetical protein